MPWAALAARSASAWAAAAAVASMSKIVRSGPTAPLSWRRSSMHVSIECRGAPTRITHNRLHARPEAGVSRTKKERPILEVGTC
jgi:hypothetical protein